MSGDELVVTVDTDHVVSVEVWTAGGLLSVQRWWPNTVTIHDLRPGKRWWRRG